jgi:multiple sugar transport system substrate-binding protein
MKNQFKRFPRLMAAFLAAALLLAAGCSGSTKETNPEPAAPAPAAAAEEAMELQFFGGWTGPDGDVMKSIVEKWNQENPNTKVTLTLLQWTPLFEKLITQVKAGSPPDIFAVNGYDMGQWISLGVLEPMDDMITKAGFKQSDFSAAAWKNVSYKGKAYGIPLDQHMHGLYYNKDMFTKAGLDPNKPPRTGQELIDAAIKLTVDANGKHPNEAGFDAKNVKQWGLGLPTNHHAFYMWTALMAQQGEQVLPGPDVTKMTFTDEKGVKAWQWLNDLIWKHQVVPPAQANQTNDFKAGLVAMAIDGPWQLPGLETTPNLNWGTSIFPQVFDKPASWGADHMVTVPVQKDAKRRERAMKFVTWLINNNELWAKAGHIPAVLTAADKAKTLPGRAAFVEMLPYENMLPPVSKSAQIYSSAATGPIVVASQAVLVAKKPIPESLKAMREGIDRILGTP